MSTLFHVDTILCQRYSVSILFRVDAILCQHYFMSLSPLVSLTTADGFNEMDGSYDDVDGAAVTPTDDDGNWDSESG
jgi:hypothetical protein